MNRNLLYAFELFPPREINSSKYPDFKAWVPKAIANEDQRSKTQLWPDEPTNEHQKIERRRLIRFFRKNGKNSSLIKAVANRLALCARNNRCCSGACPECGWLLQRWFVRKSKALIRDEVNKPGQQLVAISIIPSDPIIRLCKLHTLSIKNFQRRLKYALGKIGLDVTIGAIDFSFNEDKNGYASFWSPHFYLITSITNSDKRLLKEFFKPDTRIPRPVKISPFISSAWRRSYAFKTVFRRRVGYDALKTKNGVSRKCRNTSHDKLRARERLELFTYLDQIGLADRFIFRSTKPIIRATRVTIEKIQGCNRRIKAKRKNRQNIARNR
jgi:hypothetical protein